MLKKWLDDDFFCNMGLYICWLTHFDWRRKRFLKISTQQSICDNFSWVVILKSIKSCSTLYTWSNPRLDQTARTFMPLITVKEKLKSTHTHKLKIHSYYKHFGATLLCIKQTDSKYTQYQFKSNIDRSDCMIIIEC